GMSQRAVNAIDSGAKKWGSGFPAAPCVISRRIYDAAIAPIQVPQFRPKAGGVLTPWKRLAYWPANQMWPEPSNDVASKSPQRHTGMTLVPHSVGRYEDSPALSRLPAPLKFASPAPLTM